jgi:hypothetical protein
MKLTIRHRLGVGGSWLPVLCDEQGAPLPMQRNVVLKHGIGEGPTITVTFVIDGRCLHAEALPAVEDPDGD